MKRSILWMAAAVLFLGAGSAMAADTANVQVTATVVGSCSFATIPTVDFGNLDPTANVLVNAPAVDLTFNCTTGVPYTLTDNKGGINGSLSSTLDDGSGNTIPYSLTYNNYAGVGAGAGVGNEIVSTLAGTIAANTYGGAPAGIYTDTIVFTINP
ncbi:MAG: spore coat U domain-containing protein [Deltaproteobacteria bacterium]